MLTQRESRDELVLVQQMHHVGGGSDFLQPFAARDVAIGAVIDIQEH